VIHAVNAIDFHPKGTFVTVGSDGGVTTWDKDSKQRLKQFGLCPAPITAAKYNATGSLLAYATGYDWSTGLNGYNPSAKTCIFVHKPLDTEVNPKPSNSSSRFG